MAQLLEEMLNEVRYPSSITTNKAINGNGGISVGTTGVTLSVTDSAGLLAGGVIVPTYRILNDNQNQLSAANYAVNHTVMVNDNVSGTYKVVGASTVAGVASTSGSINVEVCTGTTAIGSGTNQLTVGMATNGAVNTTVNGTLIASPTTISAGARVNLVFVGTQTSLGSCAVAVVLQRLT